MINKQKENSSSVLLASLLFNTYILIKAHIVAIYEAKNIHPVMFNVLGLNNETETPGFRPQ